MNNFNIRTYACVIKDNSVLGLFEEYSGERFLKSTGGGIKYRDILLKFPGGGLEYGESLLDCLHREFKEELDRNRSSGSFLYPGSFYQHSF